jgi:23S rRNA pseudouridine955/2504/2580 synthase
MEGMTARTGARVVEVDAGRDGQRIDNFLIGRLKGMPRSHIYRLLRTGQVRVNKGRVKPTYRVREGDQVRLPPAELVEIPPARAGEEALRRLEQAIRYEDDDLLVIDKPAGLPVHGGTGLSHGLIEALRGLRPQCPDIALVHRLDRYTSGCLLAAKNRRLLPVLADLFRRHQVEKRYQVLVRGRWGGDRSARRVTARLRRGRLRSGERGVEVDEQGREAETEFRLLTAFAEASLVEARLHTGRTHQIRVHAAATGHPVAGDDKYGDEGFNRAMRALGLRRIFLHAHALGFRHPVSGRAVRVVCPLPPPLTEVVERLAATAGKR